MHARAKFVDCANAFRTLKKVRSGVLRFVKGNLALVTWLPQERIALPDDKHRKVAMGDHFICFAAQHHPAETATPMRGHDDQIAPL